jgi:two-component SAPR family response regulator
MLQLHNMKYFMYVGNCYKCSQPLPEQRRATRICNACSDINIMTKKNNWRRHGREYTRGLVRKRDNHTCQACNKVWQEGERQFDCHHINGLCGKKSRAYDKIKDIDEMITLCHKCHYNHPLHSQKIKLS